MRDLGSMACLQMNRIVMTFQGLGANVYPSKSLLPGGGTQCSVIGCIHLIRWAGSIDETRAQVEECTLVIASTTKEPRSSAAAKSLSPVYRSTLIRRSGWMLALTSTLLYTRNRSGMIFHMATISLRKFSDNLFMRELRPNEITDTSMLLSQWMKRNTKLGLLIITAVRCQLYTYI